MDKYSEQIKQWFKEVQYYDNMKIQLGEYAKELGLKNPTIGELLKAAKEKELIVVGNLKEFHAWKFKNFPKLKLLEHQKEFFRLYFSGNCGVYLTWSRGAGKATCLLLLQSYMTYSQVKEMLK